MNAFQSGTVVCLKSGGPDMTVESVQSDQTHGISVTCVWFEEKTLYRASLPSSALAVAMWPIAA
jgi:uncharacterized protein YodC (DUF2158 family)